MRAAIIGTGGIAQVHAPLIRTQPNTKLVAITDKDQTRAKSFASELKAERYYTDAEVMIREMKPDIVHVLIPPKYYAELSIIYGNSFFMFL